VQSLQRVLEQVKGRLGSLPANVKLLVGSVMIILAMALLLISQYTGDADLAPLGLPPDAAIRTDAVRHLRTMGVQYEDRGDDLYVPRSRQYEVIGSLSASEVISTHQIDFNALIEHNANPFIGRDQAAQNWLTAKMNVLSAMIGARPDVSMARVIIDTPPRTPGIGAARIAPKATVIVRMNGASLTQESADALGRMVAGAQAGLSVENVTVTDVGSNLSFIPRGAESVLSGNYLEHKQKTEAHFRRIIQEALPIPGAIVSVNAVVKNTRISSKETSFEDPKIGPRESESRDYTATNTSQSGEAGVRPNAGAAITSRSGRDSEIVESSTRESVMSKFGGRDRVIEDPTGYPLEVNAIVAIPRSHFVRAWRISQGDDSADPDAAALESFFEQKKTGLETDLSLLVRTGDLADAVAGELRVRMYDDGDAVMLPGGIEATLVGGDGGIGAIAGDSMVKNVGLGALAVVSLIMMFLMVKKANRRDPLPTATEIVGIPPALDAIEREIVGEAEEGEPVLEGMELEDAAMRTQQILDQINDLVGTNPDEVANLFHRWIATD